MNPAYKDSISGANNFRCIAMLVQAYYNHSCSVKSSLAFKVIMSMTILVILSLCDGKRDGNILFRKVDQLLFVIYRVYTTVNPGIFLQYIIHYSVIYCGAVFVLLTLYCNAD